ncbi:MAG TPA: GNAT family N-acetyltransferase [Actinomycetes bacterium]|nr:GNAT family N-acetyltransferase [Actinomycetes bacterium]
MSSGSGHGSIALREVTAANREQVEALSVTPEQSNFVADVRASLVEAEETPGACPWFRAVYSGQEPVGFVMISDNIPPARTEYLGPYFLWRLLIDTRWQGRGYGRATLDLVVDYLRSQPGAEKLLTSAQPGQGSPLGFYLKYWFSLTGAMFDDEQVIELLLRPSSGGHPPPRS